MSESPRAQTWYADWLKAAAVLRPQPDTTAGARLAKCLGLAWPDEMAQLTLDATPPTPLPPRKPDDPTPMPDKGTVTPPDESPPRPSESADDAPLLEPVEFSAVYASQVLETWGGEWDDLPPWPQPTLAEYSPPPPPLILPQRLLGVATAALARYHATRTVDLDPIINRMVRGQSIKRIPRVRRRSLRAGVQILIDLAESMQPFAEDSHQLAERLRRLLGDSRCETLAFRGDPFVGVQRVARGRPRRRQRYQLPGPRVPILLLSDGGLGPGPASLSGDMHWPSTLTTLASRQNSFVILLTPLPVDFRLPSWNRRLVWLTWDRTLNLRTILRTLVGHGFAETE